MPVTYLAQRITFFADDDVTPLLGAVDGAGNVTDPSFSTDPLHARPFLMFQPDTGSAEIDFAEGRSSIGQSTVVIGDKRRDPADQGTGIFTYLQASGVTGDTQTLRRRVLWEGQDLLGGWVTLMNAILFRSVLNAGDLVSYSCSLRDMRERERRVRLFVRNDTTCVFPRVGPRDGFGKPTVYDDVTDRVVYNPLRPPLLRAVDGVKGTWIQDLLGGSHVVFDFNDFANIELINPPQDTRDLWLRYGQSVLDGQTLIPIGDLPYSPSSIAFDKFTYKSVVAEWSPDRVTWHTLSPMPASTGAIPYRSNVFEFATIPPFYGQNLFDIVLKGEAPRPAFDIVKTAQLIPSAGDTSPVNGQVIWVRYLSALPPEKDVPKYLEEPSYGTLLRKIYDGDYSDPQVPPRVQYDVAAMAQMEIDTLPMAGIVYEIVTDMKGWVEENIYKINGYAPALNPSGLVIPVKYALPDPSVPLLEITDALVEEKKAEWEHSDALAVNKVSFTYQRDLVPGSLIFLSGTRIISTDVTIEDWNLGSAALFNAKALEFKPVTAHTVVRGGGILAAIPNLASEVGWRLAMARSADALTRFGSGAQQCKITAKASNLGVYAAEAGDWVIVNVSWLPDYQTRRRGIMRLMQITRVKKATPITREFTLVDAGPYAQPVTAPTVGNIREGAGGVALIDVTAIPAGVTARLEFSVSPTQPSATSGAWLLLVRTDVIGTFSTTPQPPGSRVWIRWRGEAQGRRPSLWGGPLSVVISGTAEVGDASLVLIAGVPRVRWAALTSTGGVRIKYQRHANGTAQPTVLGSSLDYDVNNLGADGSGYADLPFTLAPLEQVTVQVIGYPGFAAGAVTGVAGYASSYMTAQYLGAILNTPSIVPKVISVAPYATADVQLQPLNNGNEQLGVAFKDDLTTVAWVLCVSGADSTPRYVDNGTVIGPADWFWNGTTFAHVLDDIVIPTGATVTKYAQAIGAVSGKQSTWVAIVLAGVAATKPQLDALAAAEFLVSSASSALSAERVVADSTSVAMDVSTPGVAQFYVPALGIDSAKLGTNAVITSKILDGNVTPPKLAPGATVPDASKFYRGDGTWAVPAGGQYPGPGGAMSVYQTVVATTASIANNASQVLLLDIAPTVAFQRLQTSAAAWVRVYDTLAACTADAGRASTTDAVPGDAGYPIFDSLTSAGQLIWPWDPNVVGNNGDSTRIGRFYMRVTNVSGGAAAITTTIRYLPLEGNSTPTPPDVTGGGLILRFNVLTIAPVADGTELLSVPNGGSLGGNWTSSSGFGSGPRYKLARINGHPAINFASIGGNTRPYGVPAWPGVDPAEAHIFMVAKPVDSSPVFSFGGDNTNPTKLAATSGANHTDPSISTTNHTYTPGVDPSVGLLYHFHGKAGLFEAFVGLALRHTTAVNAVAYAQRILGGYFFGGFSTDMFNGDIGEFRFYSGALTDDEVLGIYLQMASDWGITL